VIKGKVIDHKSVLPIPSILLRSSSEQTLTDEQGYFKLKIDYGDSIIVDDIDYGHFAYQVDSTASNYYEIKLNRSKKQKFKPKEQRKQREVLNEIYTKNAINNFYKSTGFSYSTYNKLTINTDNEEQNYNLLAYLKKIVPKRYFNFQYNPKHHIFLMESYTDKNYKSAIRNKEIIHKSKVTGISRSTLFSFNSDYQFTSVYERHLFFNLTKYKNPLFKKSYNAYNYYISDTLLIHKKPKLLIKFYPKNKNLFDAIQGSFVWDLKEGYVENISVTPIRESGLSSQLSQKYVKAPKSKHYIPYLTITSARSFALGYKNIFINGVAKTYVHNFHADTSFPNKKFDENIYEYKENYDPQYDTLNWLDLRKEEFTDYDSSTFALYEKFGQIKNLEKVINIGHNVYEGKIPVKKINFLLNRIVNYNKVEGFRIGLGIETNDHFSKRAYAQAYVGYGTLDQNYKYGSILGKKLHDQTKLWLKVGYHNDLSEPGRVDHLFDKQQYSSESIRKYQLQLLDRVERINILTYLNPWKYTQIGLNLSKETVSPFYNYRYEGKTSNFHFQEAVFMINYAYGRQFIKYADKQIYFRDKFPVLSFQVTQSLPGGNSPYLYTKYDLKISYNFWFLGKGNHNMQLNFGHINGQAPYYKLYNSRGSLSNLYTTIYNSFETMSYNEFCSEDYFSVFYNVNFGRLNRTGRFKPSFVFSHNMGWGTLNHKEAHEGLQFKTMDKGYYESGFTLGDILRYNLYGLKIGLGFSTYYRYGPYKFAQNSQNFVFKLATSFRI
jgi:hypothetical protein